MRIALLGRSPDVAPVPLHRLERFEPGRNGVALGFPEIDGASPEVRQLKQHMSCVARDRDVSVLITGESGTGKERVARAIHRASSRANGPFIVVDCAGLSASLAEDTLFGHVRGAFTGAIEDRPGPFERADGGTLLLDEVGDLPLELQMKLLRALQARTIHRLGSTRETGFDVRVIAATNVDLSAARAKGRFREDLYYRLKVYEIRVPALRQRGAADIRALVVSVAQRLADRRRLPAPSIDPAALELLTRHKWPGNVRELENTVERMLVAAAGERVLLVRHLPEALLAGGEPEHSSPHVPPSADQIVEALRRHASRAGRAAAALGLSRHQLYRLVKAYGLRASDDGSWTRAQCCRRANPL